MKKAIIHSKQNNQLLKLTSTQVEELLQNNKVKRIKFSTKRTQENETKIGVGLINEFLSHIGIKKKYKTEEEVSVEIEK